MIAEQPIDGRRARRERNRQAVIAAAFALILEGKGPPSAEDVAERAGVSVSSIFRNFDGLADIQHQAIDQFQGRYSNLLLATPPGGADADLDSRIRFFVRTRLDLYEQAGPLMALARLRALEHDAMVEAVARMRGSLAAQTRAYFAAETGDRTPADATDLVSLLDSITSPESFDLMTTAHSRTRNHIARSWTIGLHALIAGWPAPRDRERLDPSPS